MLSGEQYEDIVATLGLKKGDQEKDDGTLEVPEWVNAAKDHLEGLSEETWWRELVGAWFEFERALKFPDGQVHFVVFLFFLFSRPSLMFSTQAQSNWLSPKARPEEVKYWIGRGRKYDKPPRVKSLPVFIGQFQKWWARLQPSERRDPVNPWPLLKTAPEDSASWSDVKRGGCNGLFMVLMCLSWWMNTLDADGDEYADDLQELREAVSDVHWAITAMVPDIKTSIPAPTPTPAPAPTLPASKPPAATALPALDAGAAPSPATAAPALDAGATPPPATAVSASDTGAAPPPATAVSASEAGVVAAPPTTVSTAEGASVSALQSAATAPVLQPTPTNTASASTTTPPATQPAVTAATVTPPTAPTPSVSAGSKRASPEPEHRDAPAAKKQQADVSGAA